MSITRHGHSIDLPNSRRLYIFITDGDVLLFAVEVEDNLSNDLRPTDGREQFDKAEFDKSSLDADFDKTKKLVNFRITDRIMSSFSHCFFRRRILITISC